MTFVLRLSLDDTGRLCGVLERVQTGAKGRFYGMEELTALLIRMVGAADETPPAPRRTNF